MQADPAQSRLTLRRLRPPSDSTVVAPSRTNDPFYGFPGSVGDTYDNALAESFLDSFKTELIAGRVWQSRSQFELAVVEYLGWFNNARLHESLGDMPPAEYEQLHALPAATTLVGASV